MVKLRLARFGAKKRPFYRIVATDERARRDGRFLEIVGFYDPLHNPAVIQLKSERVAYWASVGAQMSDTVRSLVKQQKARAAVQAQA